jgi:hypothetical protein
MTQPRPVGVTVLAILAGLATVAAGFHTLQFLHLLPFVTPAVAFYDFDLVGALLWGVATAIYAWVTRGLWAVEPQAWMFVLILAGFNLILAALSIAGASTWQALLPSLLVNGVVLLYCLLPGTRRAFGAA